MNILKAIEKLHLSPSTLKKLLSDLKGIFKYAIELEWMDKNPVVSSMLPVVKKKEIKIVTAEHIEAYKKFFEEDGQVHIGLIIEFDFLTGLRIQELIDLQWEDVTPRYFIVKGKGSRDRIFPLLPFPRVAEILDELKRMGFYKPVPVKYQPTLAKKLRRANRILNNKYPDLKFDGVTFHVIRKGAINNWRRLGIDTEVRNILAGHTSAIERQHYLSVPDIELLESRIEKKIS
jgi:integrase